MSPAARRYPNEDTPMSRAMETEGRLSKIETTLSHQDEALQRIETAVERGFERVGSAHLEIRVKLDKHAEHLQSLLETRKRQRALVRWSLGVVTAVVVAALLAVLKLKG